MSKRNRNLLILIVFALLVVTLYAVQAQRSGAGPVVGECVAAGRAATIYPDYGDAVIPPNIAPLNFLIQEPGSDYFVRIRGERGRPIEIGSRSGEILVPPGRWRRVLAENRGRPLHVDVFVKATEAGSSEKGGPTSWRQFDSFTWHIAAEDIDRYLAYRRIHPAHSAWREMGIYQRDLATYDETLVLSNRYFAGGCLNCHTFCNNRTDPMLISTRSADYGSALLLVDQGRIEKLGTKFGYTSWHPSEKVVAYSVNNVTLFFHSAEREVRDVLDLDSLLAYYRLDTKQTKTVAPLSRKDRLETYPTWSPDGRYLYFCSAPLTWDRRDVIPDDYNEVRYDLMRVEYDVSQDRWGELEPVLLAQDTGRSILLPRVSPDGRWLVFCMCDYGCFPVYRKSSDLYIIDLDGARESGRYDYRRLDINSDESESWHSWSSNSRWMAFSSKRGSGLFTRSYLSYIDEQGHAHKPIVLPQKDPLHYDSCLWTYSVPELIVAPVPFVREALGRAARDRHPTPVNMPITMATPAAAPSDTTDYKLLEQPQ